jgi:signal transduction histidine kinase
MLVLLAAAGAFVYWRVEYALDRGLDTELEQATGVITPLVGADGTVTPTESADATGLGWQVLDATGQVLDSGGPAPQKSLISEAQLDTVSRAGTATFDVGSFLPSSDEPYRVRVSGLSDQSGGGPAAYLLVGVRRDHRDEALRELLLQLTIAGLGALAIASLVGYVLARLALDPVERYRRRADEIAAAGAAQLRLDVPRNRDDEVTRLGHTLNHMLDALERSLDRERQFVNDASHELRTPLTLLRSRIQLTRRRPRSVEEHERALDELAVDVTRLVELAEQLLDLSPDTAGAAHSDLVGVVDSVVERWRTAQPERMQDLVVRAPVGPLPTRIAAQALDRVVTNLLTNALTHGRPPIELAVRREDSHAVLDVSDDGPGMPPELLSRATHRFSRAPEARTRPGSGLGLSIVEQVVTAADGELRLCHGGHHSSTGTPTDVRCRHDDRMTVTVILPLQHT